MSHDWRPCGHDTGSPGAIDYVVWRCDRCGCEVRVHSRAGFGERTYVLAGAPPCDEALARSVVES